MFAVKPAAGLPFAEAELSSVIFFCISDVHSGAVGNPVNGLLVEDLWSSWSRCSRSLMGGSFSVSPRMAVVRTIGLCSVAKDRDMATLHSGES